MAGIGFEIRKILKKNTLLSVFEAYGYAGLIGSGPWLLSIVALMLIGILSLGVVLPKVLIIQFLTLVTYMMAASLILTGGLQLLLTRFIADLFFQKEEAKVLPNLLGAQLITTIAALLVGLAVWPMLPIPVVTKIIILGAFVSLCNQWLGAIFLSGMKEYRLILITMLSGYAFMVLLAYLLRDWQLDGLFFAFFAGEALLFFSFLFMIIRRYPGEKLISFDFLSNKKVYYSLFFCGLFYNIGVWADKIIFWYSPSTSIQIIGTLRASPIYDLPIFLAYLSIIPGMAVFLVKMETDFVEEYDRFYTAIREGSSLEEIYYLKDNMIQTARAGLYDIFKIQGITVACLLLWGEQILTFIGIDPNYKTLLFIDVVGVGVQVIFLSILNILFYLDKRSTVLFLAGLFLVINVVLTLLSIAFGPQFYGYGFALSTIITSVVGLFWLSKQFEDLEYETFMLQ
ncbi:MULTISPECIES: exopolysaccharide Pel transporter PelG [unclassified Pseudoalteromonas]|uniref:exopolysaccharide Pel transporter PelG n=1 Tax=unclassified Pseudoalteromonas TaxID=194690 RepID=UPI0015FD902C|nr:MULTISPECIES: exopolysaccharide Pel transporter PelG [unclassified Pseudoalteromonas]MBB1281671.1 exopolysaccharide Pel transporter PelG [Pseudoalteromonas sp. SR41-1]MBB1304614.1 exopolysaccharide Pel transporter PelG [Pseudoalteromonas sp. SR43-5]MBB1451768.1 exopolysaccharide Pel transporter PelG [Pseudoalteromonas sp. SG43-1]